MMNSKLALTGLVLCCFFNWSVEAKLVPHKDTNFAVDTAPLFKGEIHYSLEVVPPQQVFEALPGILDRDLQLNIKDEGKVFISKSAFVVNKPIGFFNHQQLANERFIQQMFKGHQVKKLDEHRYRVTAPGDAGFQFELKNYYDADDISTLDNRKAIHSLSALKKMDVVFQSAPTTMIQEHARFTRYFLGGISAFAFIPLQEHRTMVIKYQVVGMKNFIANKDTLQPGYLEEITELQKLLNDFKAD